MTLILGIDPGAHGALATYDTATNRLSGPVLDMPTWHQQIGRTKRLRIDAVELAEMFDMFALMGIELIVMEAVGGYGNQPGSAGFTFGYGVGMVYMAAIYSRIPIETVTPSVWKQMMNVPGKKKATDDAIMQRANELFPHDRVHFQGKRGGKLIDRAEAAMIAAYGGKFLYPHLSKSIDFETLVRNADTGA